MTRTWEVFRFELGYQLGRASTRIYFAIFLGLALTLTRVFILDARDDGYFFNAPIITIAVTVIASMIALLVAAAVAGDAATRDVDARLDSLFYTTPVGKAAYLGGRFLGAFAVTALLLAAVPAALLLATRLPSLEPAILGPFRADAYLASYFFFAVPNAFVATAVLFAIAALSRRAISSYGGAAALFVSAFISESFLAARLGQWGLGKLFDPLGYTTLRELWRSLNPLQRNTLLPGLDGALLGNRLLWLSIAAGLLAFAFMRFRFAHHAVGGRDSAAIETAPWARIAVPPARRAFGFTTRMRQLFAIALRSLRELVLSKGWLIVPFVALAFILTARELLEVELGAPGAATTARVATILGVSETALLITLLIALSAGQLVWRERDARMNSLADVTPVPEWISLGGKFLAIALMLAFTELIFLIAGVAVQTALGVHRFELGLYLEILFGFQLTGYLLIAALAMVIHVLVNQKYVANALVVLSFVAVDFARDLGIRHNLLLFGRGPSWSYSEMAGFGLQIGPWLWFRVYWAGWALLFAVVTHLFWIRGEERGLRPRLRLARRRLTRWPAATGAMALAIIAGAGGFVFHNTNVLNHYRTDEELDRRRAEYELRYARYASLAQPVLAATKLQVDFFPERQAATIRGSYRLENRSRVAIDSIHLVTNASVETNGVTFDRPSRITLTDDDHGYRVYALGRPVQPGESVRMSFEIVYAPRGFTNDGRNESVMPNGSWIQHRGDQGHGQRQWLPFVGYRPRKFDVPSLDDVAARNDQRGREQIELETIIGTIDGQIGVAPGELRRTWSENGRRYFHYVTGAPISNSYAIYSARYAVHRAKWRDLPIEVLHHPSHIANLERMVRSAQASLDYHTEHFGPYPHKQLRLVEYPSSGRGLGLTSFPGLIEYSEGFALVRPDDDERKIDFPFAVMAHEMGHQWWGHQLVPALVEGAPLLSESLAWYSATLVVEETFGREHANRLLDIMRVEFLAPHQTREVPLLRGFDRMDAYRIGPFAMFALRETAGTERVNAALRNLLAKFDPGHPPYPTSRDLYAELRAATPPARHALLRDLFEEITYWDLRTKKVESRPAGSGYRVTLHIDAQKLKSNGIGKEKPVPMNEPLEIGVFDADGQPLYRGAHAIRSGAQTITVTVPRAPARAGIDPDHELLDRKLDDNDAEVSSMP